MTASVNRQILLVEKPSGKLGAEHFKLVNGAVPEPKDGEALLRTRLISLDAANRAWMHGATYRSAVEANSVMAGGSISEVVSSKAPGLAPGDLVFADTGWQDYAALPAKHLQKMPKIEPMSYLLSVNPKVKIYAPKDGLGGIFGSDVASTFYRKDAALPAEKRYYGGTPPQTVTLGTVFPSANIQLIDETMQLMPGFALLALVSDVPGTRELKELSLAIETPDGVVLIVWCSHPGIERIVAEAARINERLSEKHRMTVHPLPVL